MQSTYRKHHSTDTILLLVINDILRRIDLPPRCRISTPWFSSGLWHYWPYDSSGRKNRVLLCFLKTDTELVHILPWKPTGINNYWRSSVHSCALCYGVQQGSVLGPLLFTLHVYAHDTQLYIAFDPANQAPSLTAFQICMDDVMRLNTQNMLRSDAEKTEVILFTPRFTKTPNIEKLFFDSTVIDLTERVRDLGVILDKNLRLIYHINETCRKETNAIRSIGRIRKYLTNGNLKLLFNALVISRLNYCKSILYSLPKQELDRLQRTQTTAARLVTETKQYEVINPALRELHWLPVESRILFKTIRITFKILYIYSFFRSIGRPSYKNTIHHEVFVHPPSHFLLYPLIRWTRIFLLCICFMEYSSRFSLKCKLSFVL